MHQVSTEWDYAHLQTHACSSSISRSRNFHVSSSCAIIKLRRILKLNSSVVGGRLASYFRFSLALSIASTSVRLAGRPLLKERDAKVKISGLAPGRTV